MMKFPFNRALRILLSTNGFVLLAGGMIGPIYAFFVEEIGGNLMDASMAGAFFALAAGITTFFMGKYTDKLKYPQNIIIWGYALMGLGYLLFTQVNSIYSLFAVQLLIGLSEAIYSPAYDAIYSKHISQKKSGSQWGAWESTFYFSLALGAVLGGFIVSNFGFNTLFVTMGTFCWGSAFYIWKLPKSAL